MTYPTSPIDTNLVDNTVGAITPAVMRTTLHEITRNILTADTNFYISTTGSDSTGDGSSGNPWATITHAGSFLSQNIDAAGHSVIINIGAGSFQGGAILPILDANIVQVYGAGSGSTTITAGPNDGLVNNGEALTMYPTTWGVTKVTLSSALGEGIVANSGTSTGALADLITGAAIDLVFVTSPNTVINHSGILSCSVPCFLFADTGNIKVVMSGGSHSFGEILLQNNCIFQDYSTWTVQGSADNEHWLQCIRGAKYIIQGSASFSITTNPTKNRAILTADGEVIRYSGPGTAGPNWFPGSLPISVDGSSFYDGFQGVTTGTGVPTTAIFTDPGTGGFYVDNSTGNTYVAFNQGGTLKKVALV